MSTGRPARTSRAQILDAARKLLQEQGSTALSIRNVAAAVDTAPSTIYNYFGSKQGLLTTLANEMLRDVRPQLVADKDPVETLRQWMFQYRKLLLKTPELIMLANSSGPVPSIFDIGADLVALLELAGLPPKQAALQGRSLYWTVHGFVWQEIGEATMGHDVVEMAPPQHRALVKRIHSHSYDQLYKCTVERNLAGLFGPR
jgi:AcrR family transcriptional regulator